jgi:puromycin-sensitive aminopeptidase
MTDAFRLPRTVRPTRYDLLIVPNLDASTFRGRVTIEVQIDEQIDAIVLHAKGLGVSLDTLHHLGGDVPAELRLHPDREQIEVVPTRPLGMGEATLTLAFHGEISHGLLGFYRSTFVDDAGREQVLGSTQFEAPHARAAFPCFDEPEFKAVFAISLEVPEHLLAISNGPEERREVQEGVAHITYAPTIPMSTYLVAWVIGPLEATEPVDASGVAVRVVHAPGKGHLTKFALDFGAFAISYFNDYYGIPYPGEKCDLVAIPDFAFGAMENLGCVTFRETRLLLDPEQTTLDEMSGAAQTIVHEVAHMWFGDLVTMKWWNGIWLNEAFATFMEHLGVDAHRPDWGTWDDFAVGRAAALDVDALEHTRTVEYEVVTPQDADGMFDTLTYQKGGSVLRMLERWLGADAFRAGVRLYLDRYRLANTETTDLWDALEEATGKPVRQIMDSWIFQPGFPIITPEPDTITQHRFSYFLADGSEEYVVPVLARVHNAGRAESQSLLLDSKSARLERSDDALVVLNAGGEGFYRVAYPPDWRNRLLDEGVLAPLERFTLVDDLWAFVLAGHATASEFFAFARRFDTESELVVWRILAQHLRSCARLVEGEALTRYRAEVDALASPTLSRLGWDSTDADDDRVRQLRGIAISVTGSLAENPDVVARAREVVEHPANARAEVVAACVNIVAGVGSEAEFDEYLARATDRSKSPQDQLRYLFALGDFPSDELVLRAAELATSERVRAQNTPFVLQRALRNREHGATAWAFVRDNWDRLRSQLSGALMSRMLEGVTWQVDDASAADITAFIEAHPVPESARTIAQTVERLQVNRATVAAERAPFSAALLEGTSP